MKKFSFIIVLLVAGLSAGAQQKKLDSVAVKILDRMAEIIGDLNSVSFHVTIASDSIDPELGILTYYSENQVQFNGPEQMLVQTSGYNGSAGYWYNGQGLGYYSYTNNHYGVIDSSAPTSIQTITAVHEKYGIDFPAADFFYPSFTDDLINNSERIDYLGKVPMAGVQCFYIVAKGKENTIQLWIKNDPFYLPQKLVITKNFDRDRRQFEASFSEWQINPVLPPAIFEFSPPPTATQLNFIPVK